MLLSLDTKIREPIVGTSNSTQKLGHWIELGIISTYWVIVNYKVHPFKIYIKS